MLRSFVLATVIAGALTASAADQKQFPLNGAWVFDSAPPFPGVTLMQMTTRGGRTAGTVTTAWYGPITMQNVIVDGDVIAFDMRNLNDKTQATRRWTAKIDGDRVQLAGDIWYAHVEQIAFAPADAGMESLTGIRDLWTGKNLKANDTTFIVPAPGAVMLEVRGQ